jgi:hypothetical protein
LTVEPGFAQSTYGSGLDKLENLDVEDQYNATIIEPIFPQWVAINFSTTGTEQQLLVGFSKSVYWRLISSSNTVRLCCCNRVLFPGDMSSYDEFGSSSANDYGIQEYFQDNYQLTASYIGAHDASFTTEDCILISEGPVLQSQVADFDALLTSQGVMHTLLNQTNDAHTWSSGCPGP